MSKKLLISLAPLVATVAFAVTPGVAQASPHWYKNGVLIPAGTAVPTLSWGTLTLAAGTTSVSCQNAALAYSENPTGGGAGESETDNFATSNCTVSSGECKAAEGTEIQVTPESLPWGAVLEEGTFNSKPTTRLLTEQAAPATPGFGSHDLYQSTEGAVVVTHCVFRPAQVGVKQGVEALCGRAFPATTTATLYNPGTKEDTAVEALGFEVYDIEAATACSGEGLAVEEAEIARAPSTPGHPQVYDAPGAAVVDCEGDSAPHLKTGAGTSKPSEILFDQPGTGGLGCGPAGEGTTTGSLKSIGYEELEVISAK
jgi:hypothetical protein